MASAQECQQGGFDLATMISKLNSTDDDAPPSLNRIGRLGTGSTYSSINPSQSLGLSSVASGDLQELITLNVAQLDPSSPLRFVSSISATAPPTMSPTPATEATAALSPIGIALIVVGGVVLCGGVALYMYIARRIKRARWNAAGPLGDFELSAVDAVPIAAVAVLDEEDSAGVWAAPATADPGSLSGVKTEMANGVPGVQL